MLKEITRIGLASAGSVCGWVLAGLVLLLGAVLMVGIGLTGNLEPLHDMLWLDRADLAGMDEREVAGLLATVGVLTLFAGALAALVAGFVLGLFLAAAYNVTASIAGGLKVEFGRN